MLVVFVVELVELHVRNHVVFLEAGFQTVSELSEIEGYGFDNSGQDQVVLLVLVHVRVDCLLEGFHLLGSGRYEQISSTIQEMEVLDNAHRSLLYVFDFGADTLYCVFAEGGAWNNSQERRRWLSHSFLRNIMHTASAPGTCQKTTGMLSIGFYPAYNFIILYDTPYWTVIPPGTVASCPRTLRRQFGCQAPQPIDLPQDAQVQRHLACRVFLYSHVLTS